MLPIDNHSSNLFITFSGFLIIDISAQCTSIKEEILFYGLFWVYYWCCLLFLFFLSILDKREAPGTKIPPSTNTNKKDFDDAQGISPIYCGFHRTSSNAPTQSLPNLDVLWYYLDEQHEQQGPVSLIALRELWKTGRLLPTAFVWSKGMFQWKKVEELPDLKNELESESLIVKSAIALIHSVFTNSNHHF